MRRAILIAITAGALAACWSDPEESTTAEELLEGEDSVIRAGTVAPESVLTLDSAAMQDTTVRDTSAMRDTNAAPDTATPGSSGS